MLTKVRVAVMADVSPSRKPPADPGRWSERGSPGPGSRRKTKKKIAFENQQLRRLIINALDAYDNFDNSQQSHERWIVATEYLRKAVGR